MVRVQFFLHKSVLQMTSNGTGTQQPGPEKVKRRGRGPNGKEEEPKHNKRAKWPAIMRWEIYL